MGCILLFLFYYEQDLKTDVVVRIILAAGLRQGDGKLEASLDYSVRLPPKQKQKEKIPKPGIWHMIIILELGWGRDSSCIQRLVSLASQ